jgi:FAD/FMN-containing dehydrogenase
VLDPLLGELRSIVGDAHVLTDASLTAGFERDWTGRFGGPSRAVVRPADVGEVAAVLRVCWQWGAGVVPQGGNTGLVGGGVPRRGEVLVSLSRLDGVEEDAPGTVVAGAGASIADVQARARAAGWDYGVDLAARDSATVGGTIATNAGGEHAVRHGATRAHVAGLEAVLADGSVIDRVGDPPAAGGGYDLASLLAGCEGTLAVITRARLRLVAPLNARATALAGCEDIAKAVEATAALRRALPDLHALELMEPAGLALVGENVPLEREHAAYLLIETAREDGDPTEALAGALQNAPITEAVVAPDAQRRAELWRLRERHTEAIAAQPGPPAHKLDVAVPLSRLAAFRTELDAVVGDDARLVVFGHIALGNLHINVLGGGPDPDDAVLRLVARHGGSIAAEHGVGTAKVRWLPLTRSKADLDAMRAVKRALDPAGILNPGVLLPIR